MTHRLLDDAPDPTDFIPLTFGKHQGKAPKDLLDEDPSYVVWLYENCRGTVTRPLYLDACDALDRSHDRDDEDDNDYDYRGNW